MEINLIKLANQIIDQLNFDEYCLLNNEQLEKCSIKLNFHEEILNIEQTKELESMVSVRLKKMILNKQCK